MPQDSSKPGVYRSFFSCDDPKGAAECKTIRKSKLETQKQRDHRLENQNKQMSFSYNPPNRTRKETCNSRRRTDELDDPSSIKLGEITRGAQKLDQVIDTWSSGNISGRQSKDIAKNLLRGALELHESLEMLGKLQEASQYMAKWKRKQKDKCGDVAGIQRTSSDEFGSGNHRIEFQRPRLSADGSSKDCYEELRDAIREGLAKQNLLPSEDRPPYIDRTRDSAEQKPYYINGAKVLNGENAYFRRSKSFGEAKSYFDKTKLELSFDFPSTSTSQSSMCHSHEFDTTDTSFSKSFEEKPKGSNVVAKLMGLDENLPKTSPLTLEMQLRKEKELNHRRPFLDMDFPKARRSRFSSSAQKVDSGERTFDELIQTVRYKGIMKSMSIDRSGSQKDLTKVYDKRKWLADDSPPIVIMKPRHITGSMEENLYKHKYLCNYSDPKEIVRKLGMKKVVSKIGTNAKKGALNHSVIQRSLQAEMTILQNKEDKEYGDTHTRRVKQELLHTKIKGSVSAKPKLQKKEVILQEGGKSIVLTPNTGVAIDVDATKIREGPKHPNTSKTDSTCGRKSDRVSNSSKDHTSNTTVVNVPKAQQRNKIRKTNAKNNVSIAPSAVLVEKQLENVDIRINQSPESDHDLPVTKTVISETLVGESANEFSQCLDKCNVDESDLVEFSSLINEQKCVTKSSEDTMYCITSNPTEKQSCDEEISKISRNLLLDRLQDLFYTSAHQPVLPHTNSFVYHKIPDPTHLLDCGKELLEYKNQQCTQAVHPWSQIVANKLNMLSTDPLVDEICAGIEDLRKYQNLTRDKVTVDSIHKVLDKDLWCMGIVNGGWGIGWRSGFTQDEVEQIVLHIEQQILSGTIDETLEDMLS